MGEPDRRDGGPAAAVVVKRAEEVAKEAVSAGTATERQVLLGEGEAPHFAMRRFIMGEGGGMPPHTNSVEHEQFVLRGRAVVGIGDREHEVGPGSVLLIPARVPHYYRVLQAPFEFLCLVPNGPDRMELIGERGE